MELNDSVVTVIKIQKVRKKGIKVTQEFKGTGEYKENRERKKGRTYRPQKNKQTKSKMTKRRGGNL